MENPHLSWQILTICWQTQTQLQGHKNQQPQLGEMSSQKKNLYTFHNNYTGCKGTLIIRWSIIIPTGWYNPI